MLKALLWGFHNAHTGRCFPSYERLAEAAKVDRATVARAIKVLEAARVLSWENRLVRERVMVPGLFGPVPSLVPRRTSNAYWFWDPVPKSHDATGTRLKSPLLLVEPPPPPPPPLALDPSNPLDAVLIRLGAAVKKGGRREVPGFCPA